MLNERVVLCLECFHVTSERRGVPINSRMAAMLVSPTNPWGIELYSIIMQTFSFVSVEEQGY